MDMGGVMGRDNKGEREGNIMRYNKPSIHCRII